MNETVTIQTYQWDKAELSPLEYQHGYCPRRCRGDTVVDLSTRVCWDLECVPCYCQRPLCEIYNHCCPDISVPFLRDNPGVSNTVHKGNISFQVNGPSQLKLNTRPDLGCQFTNNSARDAYLFIRSCYPGRVQNETVAELCETDQGEMTSDLTVRVIDQTSHVTYKNEFCAMCNFVKNTEFIYYHNLYLKVDKYRHLKKYMRRGMETYFYFPENITRFDCDFTESVKRVDSCEAGNNSTELDPDVVSACDSLAGNNLQVYDTTSTVLYKNIFCAICNKFSFPMMNQTCKCKRGIGKYTSPFQMLFNLRGSTDQATTLSNPQLPVKSRCSVSDWESPNGQCLHVTCVQGSTFEEEQCIQDSNDLTGIGYRLLVWLESKDSYNLTDASLAVGYAEQIIDSLIDETVSRLEGLSERLTINIQSIIDNNSQILYKYPYIRMECIIVPNIYISKKMFETDTIGEWINNIQLNVNNVFLTFRLMFYNPRIRSDNLFYNENTDRLIVLNKTYEIVDSNFTPRLITEYKHLTKLLECPFVQFNQSNYSFHVDETEPQSRITITLDLDVVRIQFNESFDLNQLDIDANGGLRVCKGLLEEKLPAFVVRHGQGSSLVEDSVTGHAEYVLTMTCLTLSILCILLTLFTYFMFPVLRTDAGVNNMFLSLSLLSAQVSLLASSHFFRSSVECVILGITTHFMWLWMFAWSLICSHHMYRVFTAATPRSTPQNATQRFWTKVVFSVSCPAAIVVTNILFSYFSSHGTQLGYGLVNCYLNSSLHIGISLVGPLSVTIVVNVVFFLITVHKIYKVRQLQSSFTSFDQQANWTVYLRLSTVTGAFWVVAIIASALDSTVLRFISTVLNGLQGVAIFVSYICNRRVLNLYSQLRRTKTERAADVDRNGQTVTTTDIAGNPPCAGEPICAGNPQCAGNHKVAGATCFNCHVLTYYLRPPTYYLRPPTYYLTPPTYYLRPPTYYLRPPTYYLRPPTYYLTPPTYYLTPPTYYLRPPTYYLTPPTYYLRPPTYYLRPPTYYLTPPTYYLRPPTYYLSPHTYYLTPTTYYLRPPTYYLRPPTYYLRPPTYYLRPPTYYLRPPTYYLRPPTYYLRPPTYYLRPPTYYLTPLTYYLRPPTYYLSPHTYYLTPPTYYLRPPTYYLRPPTYYLRPPTYYLTPPTYYLRPPTYYLRPPTYYLRPPTYYLRPPTYYLRPPTYYLRPPTYYLTPPTYYLRPPTYYLRPPTYYLTPPTYYLRPPTYYMRPPTYYLRPPTYYLRPPTYYLRPPTYYLRPPTYYLRPPTYYLTPPTYYMRPPTYYLRPPTYYLRPPTYYLRPPTYYLRPPTYYLRRPIT
ncbi:hypothetical protein Btru_031309 [Bulinus truncatus]|nr:hypothetical protein Btru_031309 [Bulinus truncatus]